MGPYSKEYPAQAYEQVSNVGITHGKLAVKSNVLNVVRDQERILYELPEEMNYIVWTLVDLSAKCFLAILAYEAFSY